MGQVYRCFIIWDSQWHIIALPALIYLASVGARDLCRPFAGVAHCCAFGLSLFYSARDYHRRGGHLTGRISTNGKTCSPGRAVVLAERGTERHSHYDDLRPYPADACARPGCDIPRDVQHVYQYSHNADRVCRTLFHPRDRSHHYCGPGCGAQICFCLCLEHLLR